MVYCTAFDLELRYGTQELIQLTDRNGAKVLNQDVLSTAIADACAIIDSYLQDGGYTLPLVSVPVALIRPACILTRCYLYDDKRTEQVDMDCKATLSWLSDIADGKITIPGLNKPSTSSGVAANTRTLVYADEFVANFTL